jgi:hypothetical protein
VTGKTEKHCEILPSLAQLDKQQVQNAKSGLLLGKTENNKHHSRDLTLLGTWVHVQQMQTLNITQNTKFPKKTVK